jgi:hypothetical protein
MKSLSKVRGMSRLSKVALVVGGLGLAGVIAAGPAFAGTPVPGTTGTTSGNAAGTGAGLKGTSVIQYKTSYTDSFFGPVSCTGVHQSQTKGNVTTTQESFTCASTSGIPLTNVSPGQQVTWGPNTWQSDFNHSSLDQTFSATVSSDAMSYTAVATY